MSTFFAGIKEKFAGFSGNSDLGFVIGLFYGHFSFGCSCTQGFA